MCEWNFKENIEPQGSSDGFWYDITNGYIKPEEILADDEVLEEVMHAIKLLEAFEYSLQAAGIVEEM